MSTVDVHGNFHAPEGAPRGGQFTGRVRPRHAEGLTAEVRPRTVFVRTSAGVRRAMAVSVEEAVSAVSAAHPDEVVFGMVSPDVHVSATAGPITVQYDWEGEGTSGSYDPEEPDDVPLLRLTVRLDGGTAVGYGGGSWCTGTPATVSVDAVNSRAIDVAQMLASQVQGHDVRDQVQLVRQFLRRSADAPDPVLSLPTTPETIAAAFPVRRSGTVMGYAVVPLDGGGRTAAMPFPHEDDAEHLRSVLESQSALTRYGVRLVPVTTPDGQTVQDGSAWGPPVR